MKPRGLFHHRAVAAIAIAGAAALAGCAYSLINGGQVNETIAGKVEQGIQDIRQLSFRSTCR
jgi:hypothetical protein